MVPARSKRWSHRQRALVRLDPRPQGDYQQILLANPDQAVFVFACAHPDPKLRMLDRFLVIAEKQKVPAVIVANKTDLVKDPETIFGMYTQIGYRVIYTSASDGRGLNELRGVLAGRISALAGPSGVGKSSLLNALQPGLGLAVNEISMALNKGRHTTVSRQLLPVEGGGYVADTPGWKSLALWDTEPEEMDAYFPELAPLVSTLPVQRLHPPARARLRGARRAGAGAASIPSGTNPTCDCAPAKPDLQSAASFSLPGS